MSSKRGSENESERIRKCEGGHAGVIVRCWGDGCFGKQMMSRKIVKGK